jgi:hypothetical protein
LAKSFLGLHKWKIVCSALVQIKDPLFQLGGHDSHIPKKQKAIITKGLAILLHAFDCSQKRIKYVQIPLVRQNLSVQFENLDKEGKISVLVL